jgi:hypothetical protein
LIACENFFGLAPVVALFAFSASLGPAFMAQHLNHSFRNPGNKIFFHIFFPPFLFEVEKFFKEQAQQGDGSDVIKKPPYSELPNFSFFPFFISHFSILLLF